MPFRPWRNSKKRIAERNKRIIREFKNVPCADCRKRYPFYVMDFDHVRGKKECGIANFVTRKGCSVEKLLEEIAKCDVVCANCHRKRTHKRSSGLYT